MFLLEAFGVWASVQAYYFGGTIWCIMKSMCVFESIENTHTHTWGEYLYTHYACTFLPAYDCHFHLSSLKMNKSLFWFILLFTLNQNHFLHHCREFSFFLLSHYLNAFALKKSVWNEQKCLNLIFYDQPSGATFLTFLFSQTYFTAFISVPFLSSWQRWAQMLKIN